MKRVKNSPPKPLVVVALMFMGAGVAKAQSPWVGNYYGLGIGGTQTRSSSSTRYENSGTSPATGWQNDQFRGDVYNSVSSMQALDAPPDMGWTPTNGAMPALDTWASSARFSDNKPTGVAMIGFNRQSDQIVWGGELRSTFGNFGAEQSSSRAMSGSKTGTFSDGEGAQFTFTNYGNVITSPTSSPVLAWYSIDYTADYSQTSTQTQRVKVGMINAALARVGYSLGDTLIYAVGGLAQATVKASSTASVTESVTGIVSGRDLAGSISSPITGTRTYNLYGEQSKSVVGFAIGAGAEWLVGKDLSLRAEGTYYSLGSVRANVSTTDGVIRYTTDQDVKARGAFVALIKKF